MPVEQQMLNSFFLSSSSLLRSLDNESFSVDISGRSGGKSGNGAGALKDILMGSNLTTGTE